MLVILAKKNCTESRASDVITNNVIRNLSIASVLFEIDR